MGSKPVDAPLIAIVGETASGKSSLALALAEQFGGEIICADSRTLYKGMDIGTAKPTMDEQSRVRHHLLDVAEIDQPITASDFKLLAEDAISEIASRGKVPFLVGGSGLYVDGVLFDFEFAGEPDLRLRTELELLSVDELQGRLLDMKLELPKNARNPRHLIRRIETGGATVKEPIFRNNTIVMAWDIPKEQLTLRIQERVSHMIRLGLEAEVSRLTDLYGWDVPSMYTIGYQEFRGYFDGQVTLPEVEADIVRHTTQFARRQRQWFKRNKYLHYLYNKSDAVDLITTLLNK